MDRDERTASIKTSREPKLQIFVYFDMLNESGKDHRKVKVEVKKVQETQSQVPWSVCSVFGDVKEVKQ